jgi:hypothetical protein
MSNDPFAVLVEAMKTAVHASVDARTQLLEPWDGETVHRWAPGHSMGCPVCEALEGANNSLLIKNREREK